MKKLTWFLLFVGLSYAAMSQSSAIEGFVRVVDAKFQRNEKPYTFIGTNFWYGMNLGASGPHGNRQRLLRELDHLQALGVTNLRIMAASEGPDSEPWRMVPALQTEPGTYQEDLLNGLDFLLAEMAKRDMTAVVCLGNMWPWSGGFAQYINWVTGEGIPYPPPAEGGKWLRFMNFSAQFFRNAAAQKLYEDHIRFIVNRVNHLSGKAYKADPTIMAWQLANEPRSIFGRRRYLQWVRRTARLIKELDPHHLVSIGSEGNALVPFSRKFRKEHRDENIDYTTAHLWLQNWGWYDPSEGEKSFEGAMDKARRYVARHHKIARRLGKPLVMEEFGLARDAESYDPASNTHFRDQYYDWMFGRVVESVRNDDVLVGANFWAWAGEGRPRVLQSVWQPGDDFTGDPPFEFQGWYSVFDRDISTLKMIEKRTKELRDQTKEKKIARR